MRTLVHFEKTARCQCGGWRRICTRLLACCSLVALLLVPSRLQHPLHSIHCPISTVSACLVEWRCGSTWNASSGGFGSVDEKSRRDPRIAFHAPAKLMRLCLSHPAIGQATGTACEISSVMRGKGFRSPFYVKRAVCSRLRKQRRSYCRNDTRCVPAAVGPRDFYDSCMRAAFHLRSTSQRSQTSRAEHEHSLVARAPLPPCEKCSTCQAALPCCSAVGPQEPSGPCLPDRTLEKARSPGTW